MNVLGSLCIFESPNNSNKPIHCQPLNFISLWFEVPENIQQHFDPHAKNNVIIYSKPLISFIIQIPFFWRFIFIVVILMFITESKGKPQLRKNQTENHVSFYWTHVPLHTSELHIICLSIVGLMLLSHIVNEFFFVLMFHAHAKSWMENVFIWPLKQTKWHNILQHTIHSFLYSLFIFLAELETRMENCVSK